MDGLIECANDISKVNIIYMVILVATSNCLTNHRTNDSLIDFINEIISNMNSNTYNTSLLDDQEFITSGAYMDASQQTKASLLVRIFRRFILLSDQFIVYAQNQFNEHTATSIASCSVLIILLSIICCFIISLMREEERKIKEQYKKLNTGSSSSFLAIGQQQQQGKYHTNKQNSGKSFYHHHHHASNPTLLASSGPHAGHSLLTSTSSTANYSPLPPRNELFSKMHVIELRRETYFGLVRLSKPGCRTIVLLCDQQSKVKLLAKFYQYIYPYRKNKILMFAFLLIEKNIGWYEDLLKLALNEKRDLHINPINCIGTVLILNGFKKWFSVYHESDTRNDPDEPFVLLEESLLDNLSDWLERALAGRVSRFHVRYWPHQMK